MANWELTLERPQATLPPNAVGKFPMDRTAGPRVGGFAALRGDRSTARSAKLDDGIPTEPGTNAPETIEIDTIAQGGAGGLQALVKYVPGGGDHATTKSVQWQVVGTDADFAHTSPLDPSGNALGPFTVGQVVKIRTLVANSAATRTTAPRTITLAEPIE